MSTKAVTAEGLLSDIVTDLNIFIQWAEAARDASKIAEHVEGICSHYRAMAICLLVSDGNVDDFFHWLLHSPLTRKFQLAKARDEGLGGSRAARASFVDPMLDAIASRQWKLASDIADLTAPEWIDGAEYEDDFCYGDFLRRVLRQQDDGLDQLLARWRGVLEGGTDTRLDVAEALAAGDAAGFEDSLRNMLAERESHARAMANPKTRSPLASELPFFPNRWVSLDGLALLAIAERRGITIQEDVEACPRLVRAGKYAPFYPRGYPNRGLD